MPTPRVMIDALPPVSLPLNPGDLIVVQQAGVTKRAAVTELVVGGGGGGGGDGTGVTDGDKGDVVVTGSGTVWNLDSTVVTAAARTVLDDTTVAAIRATLGAAANTAFTTSTAGIVPTPGGTSSGRFLMDDATWAPPPGGSVSAAGNVFPFTYNTSILESITGSQLRGNSATFASSTKLWVSEVTTDGLDVSVGLGRIKAGFQVYVQDYTTAARYAQWTVTANAVDKGTYWELAVTPLASAGTIPGGKVAFQSLSTAQTNSLFSTTTSARGLAPGSNGATASFLRGDGTWAAVSSSGGGIVQQPTPPTDTTIMWADTSQVGIEENVRYLSNVTATTYTLVLADRGKLLLCSNAAAQTVTVPTNATAAFVVGTQLDLVQMGAGVLNIAAAGGVTINATPSLSFRSQYSGASLVKTATNSWLLFGDLS